MRNRHVFYYNHELSRVGHSESNGCVRMTNWDAEKVAAMIRPGTEVIL